MMNIPFVKMQGAGNDYIYVIADALPRNMADMVRRMSDRHFGIGGDGIVYLLPPSDSSADVTMRMFNSDGTEAEMCGNAVRCVARLAYERHMTEAPAVRVATKSGVKKVALHFGHDGFLASVDMGKPMFTAKDIPSLNGGELFIDRPLTAASSEIFQITAVSMGNPHAVLFVADVDAAEVHRIGKMLEHHPLFPNRTNVEFVQIVDREHIKLRVWERGAGETLACGTGTCASLAACVANNLTERHIRAQLPGGILEVEFDEQGHIRLTGPAEPVFSGVWPEDRA
ncbi:MAG: diaminopimelate epimerase [Desulfovibrionaceae bacterium]|nr:diaminopimelate epimerase [Desulfovibrionaceae bacterium]